MDINHPAVVEYICASKEIAAFYKTDLDEPVEVSNRYKSALDNLRNYLDGIGMKMPAPIYPIDIEDKKTWKYLTVRLTGNKARGKKFSKDVENPDWIYKK